MQFNCSWPADGNRLDSSTSLSVGLKRTGVDTLPNMVTAFENTVFFLRLNSAAATLSAMLQRGLGGSLINAIDQLRKSYRSNVRSTVLYYFDSNSVKKSLGVS